MGNYVKIGPLAVRVSTKGIADWGYPLFATRDYAFLMRDSGGGLCLAGFNPHDSLTWVWGLRLHRVGRDHPIFWDQGQHFSFQRRRTFRVPFTTWALTLSTQARTPRPTQKDKSDER